MVVVVKAGGGGGWWRRGSIGKEVEGEEMK